MMLPLYVSSIIEILNKNGYEAFVVGGCVRDFLLGITPDDYDVTTNAKPIQIKQCLSDYKVIDTGIEFGTVTVISEGIPVEVTTYRIDGEYNDNRRPENVAFTASLEEDLKRRDFTVNAMAYNPMTGFVDLFNGKDDLKKGIIRAIGNPTERFNEDGLRIMRAIRFASRYDFIIEEKTSEAIHNCRNLLKNIASERIAVELNKLLCGKCEAVLREYPDVLSVFIPELDKCVGFEQHTKYHNKDVYEHIIATVAAIEPVKHLRLAMLFHDMGKPEYFTMDENGTGHFKGHAIGSCEIAERVLKNLKYDNETTRKVLELIKSHDILIENRENLIKRYLNRYGVDMFRDIIAVHIADDIGKSPEYQDRIETYRDVLLTVEKILDEQLCFSLKDLAVNGNDIKKLGFKGKNIGAVLNSLLDMVIDGKCKNERKELLDKAEKQGVFD